MAKLTSKFEQETRERVLAFNTKELLEVFKRFTPCEELPADAKEFLAAHKLPRVGKVKLVTFTSITALKGAEYYGEKQESHCFAAVVKGNTDAFPTMHFYYPACAQQVAAKNILGVVVGKLKNGFGLDIPQNVEEAIHQLNVDTAPKNIRFEGCKERFQKLLAHEKNVVHNDCLVEHRLNDEVVWTIFIPDFDYRKVFANRVANITNISIELAEQISNAWNHEFYASVNPEVANDARKYASMIPAVAGLSEGDVVEDLLQGSVQVINYLNKLYIDIDDELPSAVFIKGKLNIYLPPISEKS